MTDTLSTGPLEIISRSDARARGLLFYFTGTPCRHGHVAPRWVANFWCVECQRSPDQKVKAGVRARRHEQKRRAEDPEAYKADRIRQEKARRARDPEKYRSAGVAKTERWKRANPDRARELFNGVIERRRARKAGVDGTFSAADITRILIEQHGLCANPYCLSDIRPNYTIDHIVPLCRGGSGAASNIQLLCLDCNRKKHMRTMEEWLSSM